MATRVTPTSRSLVLFNQLVRIFSTARGLSSEGKINAKELRFRKNELLRKNRRNLTLERQARTCQLLVPLDTVHSECKEHYGGRQQLQAIGSHYHIYQDIFGSVFLPQGSMYIHYGEGEGLVGVEQGNIIPAEKAREEPAVSLPAGLGEGFASLVLTDPDGHLTNGTMELLHWMIVNIPCGGAVTDGTLVTPYLQPLPPRGSGIHRYVFSLFTHPHPLPETTPTGEIGDSDWLKQRTFSTGRFLAENEDVTPFAFSFFQSHWDESVHSVYMQTLAHPEPVYKLERKPTPRQARQKLIKVQRSARYSVM